MSADAKVESSAEVIVAVDCAEEVRTARPGANVLSVQTDGLFERIAEDLSQLEWLLERVPTEADLTLLGLRWIRAQAAITRLGRTLAGSISGQVTALDAASSTGPIDVLVTSKDSRWLSLPWELARVNDSEMEGLAALGSFNRVPYDLLGLVSAQVLPDVLRVVSVSPRPFGMSDVAAAGTQGSVVTAAVRSPDAIKLSVVRPASWMATVEELNRGLGDGEPNVLHFDGHGAIVDNRVGLLFEGPGTSQPETIFAEQLVDDLTGLDLRLVMLNACRSGGATETAASIAAIVSEKLAVPVIGMGYSVKPRLVAVFMSAFMARLGHGESPSDACSRARQVVKQRRTGHVEPHVPFHIIPRYFGPTQRRLDPLSSSTESVVDVETVESDAVHALTRLHFYERFLATFDQKSRESKAAVLLRGPALSGKSTFISAYRQYAQFVRSKDELPVDAITESNDLVSETLQPSFELPDPPIALAGMWVNKLVSSIAEARNGVVPGSVAWECVMQCGNHLGSMSYLEWLAVDRPLRDAVFELKYGAPQNIDENGYLERIITAFRTLPKEIRHDCWIVGLLDNSIVGHLLVGGGLKDDAFHAILGHHISRERWEILNKALASVGLARLVPGSNVYTYSAVVRYALRGVLRRNVSAEEFYALDAATTDACIGAVGGLSDSANTIGPRPENELGWLYREGRWKEMWEAFLDGPVDHSLGWCLENGEDDRAVALMRVWADIDVITRRSGLLEHTVPYALAGRRESAPLPWAQYKHIVAVASVRTENWEAALQNVAESNRFYAMGGSDRDLVSRLVIEARATWRLNQGDDKGILDQAEMHATGEPSLEAWVRSAREDLAVYRFAYGVDDITGDNNLSRIRRLELANDFAGASRLQEQNVAAARLQDNQIHLALELTELGRLRGVELGDPRGIQDLEESLSIRYAEGMDVSHTLYLLGTAYEALDNFPEALFYLDAASVYAEQSGSELERAEIDYERALVLWRQADDRDTEAYVAARDLFDRARTAYQAADRPILAADALMSICQIERVLTGSNDRARQYFDDALKVGGAAFTKLRGEIIDGVNRMLEQDIG